MDKDKIECLRANGIVPIDPKYKYAKAYGNTVMFYSEEYLENKTIEEIAIKDKENADYFSQQDNPVRTWLRKLINRTWLYCHIK
jgi:hypothetical protein